MPHWSSEDDDRILAASADDPTAFSAFYERYEGPMLAFFRRRTGDPELAADLTAEVFAAALASRHRFRPGKVPASAWLFSIANHKLAHSRRRGAVEDRARRRLGMPALVVEDEELERVDQLGLSDEQVLSLLEALPIDQHEAVYAHVLQERPYDEIASELRCSAAVVRKRVSRGLARLRKEIAENKT
ncbi:MAG: RNA polymerase sigma factor [Solirubrobacteraceae bacterium]